MLDNAFFDRDAQIVAKQLLGKVIRRFYQNQWLSVKIIETEAYYKDDKASHASLGFTEKRKALFMPAGTIYMYYARGGDSLNISTQGEGNAVLIKSGIVYENTHEALKIMHLLNPRKNGEARETDRLCSGQTLLCKSLAVRVPEWDKKRFDLSNFYFEDVGYLPKKIIQTTRLGIPRGRDEHLLYRFIDERYLNVCSKKTL